VVYRRLAAVAVGQAIFGGITVLSGQWSSSRRAVTRLAGTAIITALALFALVLPAHADPGDPNDPSSPLNPNNPANPANPLSPLNPANPASPLNPNNPASPLYSDNNHDTPRGGKPLPSTGSAF
jgi:hypothetical protein